MVVCVIPKSTCFSHNSDLQQVVRGVGGSPSTTGGGFSGSLRGLVGLNLCLKSTDSPSDVSFSWIFLCSLLCCFLPPNPSPYPACVLDPPLLPPSLHALNRATGADPTEGKRTMLSFRGRLERPGRCFQRLEGLSWSRQDSVNTEQSR